jgi:DNA-directed RNA polymerase specialized sigma24 family protein
MTNEPFDETTTIIVNKIAAGDRMALEEFVHCYNWKTIRMADRYLRRLRTHLVTCDAEDAVNDTLAKFYRRAVDGGLPRVAASAEFWNIFFTMMKDVIRLALRQDAAIRRGGTGSCRSRDERRRRDGPGGSARPWREDFAFDRLSVDDAYAILPPQQDLMLIRLQVEEFLQHLHDPILRRIAMLRLEAYTNVQIAELLELNKRTIERKLVAIRMRFLEYEAGW